MKKAPDKTVIVPGFKFSGISAGLKKTRNKDLALIYSDSEAVIAGLFTTNKIKAAPVKLDIARIISQRGQAIIVTSGNANACTGKQGLRNAREMAQLTAHALGIPSRLVYVSSTGVIGKSLPMNKIRNAIPEAVHKLAAGSIKDAAAAIMTTDTFPKIVSRKINIAGKKGTIAGIAKGAGMINPNMATMLCFIVTDIAVGPRALNSALGEAVKKSFNRLTVDNDMSTNDTVMIMANGMIKNKPITKGSPLYGKFENALSTVAYDLAKMIVSDAEGATKLVEVIVKGAKSESDAEKAARAIAGSLLVKTAVYGKSPNWGRIIAAIGYSGARVKEEKITLHINNFKVVSKGVGVHKAPKSLFSKDEITITADLNLGKKEACMLTSDLTEQYVKINASYLT